MKSIALIEVKNVSSGVFLLDLLLKASKVDCLQAGAVCPGKFMIILAGGLGDINISLETAKANGCENLIDTFVLGNVSKEVFPALAGACEVREKGALGIIETFTAPSCIQAADTAVKGADISLIEIRVARGMAGKSFVSLTGDVADVTMALESGTAHAKSQGLLVGCQLIANPHGDIWKHI